MSITTANGASLHLYSGSFTARGARLFGGMRRMSQRTSSMLFYGVLLRE